jgi:predicted nucleic acid-binding protein
LKFVVDASVALKWLMPDAPGEQDVDKALAVLSLVQSGKATLLAPVHWSLEVLAVVARRGVAEIIPACVFLSTVPCETRDGLDLLEKAAKLSAHLKHHMFDTLYHAVALAAGATLLTADEVYFRKAQGEGAIVLLADFKEMEV